MEKFYQEMLQPTFVENINMCLSSLTIFLVSYEAKIEEAAAIRDQWVSYLHVAMLRNFQML